MNTAFTTDEKLMLFEIRRAILVEYYPRAKLDIEALMKQWDCLPSTKKPVVYTRDYALRVWDYFIMGYDSRIELLQSLYAQVYYLEEQCQNQF